MTAFQWTGAITVIALLAFGDFGFAQNATETARLPDFGDTVEVLGSMERTDQDFKDGLALDLFSPKPRTLVVQQNKTPLPAQFVSGSSGESFVSISNYSYIIKFNETANDLIAKIEIPYDPIALNAMGVQEANTFVATLSPDKLSWVVVDQTRNVHRSENNTRIIKMTSLDGEYMLIGRQSIDTSNIFVQYGQGETRTVNLTGGAGKQEAEFVDGLRFSVTSDTPMRMNVALKYGVNPGTLPSGMIPLNNYAWIVNTTNPKGKIAADMRVPFNRMMLAAALPSGSSPTTMLVLAKRPLNATSGEFLPLKAESQLVMELNEDRILVPSMTQLDGQYLILITAPKVLSMEIPPAQSTTPPFCVPMSVATSMSIVASSLPSSTLMTAPIVGSGTAPKASAAGSLSMANIVGAGLSPSSVSKPNLMTAGIVGGSQPNTSPTSAPVAASPSVNSVSRAPPLNTPAPISVEIILPQSAATSGPKGMVRGTDTARGTKAHGTTRSSEDINGVPIPASPNIYSDNALLNSNSAHHELRKRTLFGRHLKYDDQNSCKKKRTFIWGFYSSDDEKYASGSDCESSTTTAPGSITTFPSSSDGEPAEDEPEGSDRPSTTTKADSSKQTPEIRTNRPAATQSAIPVSCPSPPPCPVCASATAIITQTPAVREPTTTISIATKITVATSTLSSMTTIPLLPPIVSGTKGMPIPSVDIQTTTGVSSPPQLSGVPSINGTATTSSPLVKVTTNAGSSIEILKVWDWEWFDSGFLKAIGTVFIVALFL